MEMYIDVEVQIPVKPLALHVTLDMLLSHSKFLCSHLHSVAQETLYGKHLGQGLVLDMPMDGWASFLCQSNRERD